MSADNNRNKTMSKDVEELMKQINAIRDDILNLTDTVSKITSNRVSEAGDMAREKVGEAQKAARESVGEVEALVQRNPLQAALVAVGVGFLIGLFSRR